MLLAEPHLLWLLLVVPLVGLLHRRHRAGLSSRRSAAVVALRILVFSCLIMALSRPLLRTQSQHPVRVAVVDVSASMSVDDLRGVEQHMKERLTAIRITTDHLVVFDRRARQVVLPDSQFQPGWLAGLRDPDPAPGSALAEALELAASLIPKGDAGQVMLYTDGLGTGGDARTAAIRLGQRGIGLTIEPCGSSRKDDLVLVAADLPAEAGAGATVPLRVELDVGRDGPGTLAVTPLNDAGSPILLPVDLNRGLHEQIVPLPLTGTGVQRFSIRCDADWDSRSDNNELTAVVRVAHPYRVRMVETDEDGPATQSLARLLGPAAEVSRVAPDSLTEPSLSEADLLVIADTPAERISPPTQQRIVQAATDGLGVFFVGGRQSFGPGGYYGSELARIMPLDFPQQTERRDPSVTLVVIIDTSGSMTGPRIALAKEIARLAIRRLQPHDKVGIVEFYGTKRWAARIQSAGNAIDINRALNRLSAGGGTVILPALEEAYYALLNVQTRTKHVLIITDGGVETGPFQAILTRMADAGMTASAVMAGPGQHSTFLASLAHWGRGRFYAAPDRFNLPEIILKQPESIPASAFAEQTSRLAGDEGDPVLAEVGVDAAPPLAGYVRTRPRPTADLLLQSDRDEPILVRWRYGGGFVAAWTADLGGPWSQAFTQWPGASPLFSNLVRQLATAAPSRALRVEPLIRPEAIEVRIDAVGAAMSAPTATIELTVTSPSGIRQVRSVEPLLPGQWNVLIPTDEPGLHDFEARTGEGRFRGSAAIDIPPVREFCATEPAAGFLEELQRIAADAAGAAGRRERATHYVDLWPWLVLAALVLFMLTVLVRRWPVRPGVPAATVPAFLLAACLIMSLTSPSVAGVTSAPASDLSQAREVARRRDLALAHRTLKEAIAAGRVDADVYADLARYAELMGEDEAAAETLAQAIARTTDPRQRSSLEIRRACLLFDIGKQDEARTLLEQAAQQTGDPSASRLCGHLAGLLGEPGLAVSILQARPAEEPSPREALLEGMLAADADRLEEAERCLARAAGTLPSPRDRRYAVDQLVAVARRRGELAELADRWLADPDLPVERLFPLLNLLRELHRVDDVLALLKREPSSPAHGALLASAEFQEQVVAAAIDEGRLNDAVATFQQLIRTSPDPMRWRIALARLWLLRAERDPAVTLFRQAVEETRSAPALFELADAARDLALDEVALDAVAKAAEGGPDERFQAGLWRAGLAEKRGDVTRAVKELDEILPIAEREPGLLRQLSDAFEKFNQPGRAIELLQRIVEQTNGEDHQLRLAWLLEQNQRLPEACRIWRRIWENSTAAARRHHAAGRLLELSAKTGTLADLAIEIEEKLGQGKADARELSLLVDLYTQVGDAVSTAEILFTFARQTGDELGALKQLARAYLRMQQLAQTDAILHRLLVLDPDHAMDYLQELTVLNVERQRPQEAAAAVEQMAALGEGGSVVQELSAGVFDLIGDHERAAQNYEQVLAQHPDRVEVWLLWANAMRSAGHGDQAITRLQLLADEAHEDDLFLVAVDGLLNLEAGRGPLRSALRRIMLRIAAAPEKIFLYDVAADVLDSIGRADRINPLMEQALAYAGEQRGALLREMMERAKAEGRQDRHIAYGQALIALDFNVPPPVLLDLGETLLGEQRRAEADRAFARASALGDYVAIRQKVADAYERALLPVPAQQIVGELLVIDPDNVALLNRHAALLEQTDQWDQASARYRRALEILIGRTPRVQEGRGATAPAQVGAARRVRVATNVDEMTQFLDPTIDGLMVCARTDTMRTGLVEWLAARAGRELDEVLAAGLPSRPIGQHPRLARLAECLRLVAFSLHQPDAADAFDRRLQQAFPSDTALASAILDQRLAWGLIHRAAALADASPNSAALPVPLVVHHLIEQTGQLETAFTAGVIEPAIVTRLLPALIMLSRDAEARRLIERCESKWQTPTLEGARTVLMACVALDEQSRLHRWLLSYLDACRTLADAKQLTDAVSEGIRLTWHLLASEQQSAIIARLGRLAGEVNPRSIELDLIRLQLAQDRSEPVADRDRILRDTGPALAGQARHLAEVLQRVKPEERLSLLEQAWTACRPADRLDLLLTFAGANTQPLDSVFIDGFNRLLDTTGTVRLDKFSPYSQLVQAGWHDNRVQPALGVEIADHLVGQLGQEIPVQAAAASAYAAAGDADRAASIGQQAIGGLFAARKLEAQQERMLRQLVEILPRQHLRMVAGTLSDPQEMEKASAIQAYALATILAHLELEHEAVSAYERAFNLGPANEVIRREFIQFFEARGRSADLIRLLDPHVADRSIVQTYELGRLGEAYRVRYRPAEALRVFAQDSGPLANIRALELEAMLGREDRLKVILRRFLAVNRLERRFYTPLASRPLLPGGLKEHELRQRPDFTRQFSLFSLLADVPTAAAEFEALWQSAPPDRRDVPGLVEARLRAADAQTRQAMGDELGGRLAEGTFHARDLRLLAALATDGEVTLPSEIVQVLGRQVAWVEPEQVEPLEAWASLSARLGDRDQAAATLRWLVAVDMAQPRRTFWGTERFRRLDLYLTCLPEDRRAAETRRLYRAAMLNPIEPPEDRLDATILRRLADAGEPELAAEALARAEVWLNRLAEPTFLPRLRRECAYAALLRGETDVFDRHLEALVRLCAVTYGDVLPLDPLGFLPPADRLADAAGTVEKLRRAIRSAARLGRLTPTQGARSLVLLGEWCLRQNMAEPAREAWSEARQFAGDTPCERWLWVIDLGEQLNSAAALDMSTAMLKAGLLPMMRAPGVLEQVERAQDPETADALAFEAATSTDHPTILHRAIQHATRTGDHDQVRELTRRLKVAASVSTRPASSVASDAS